MLTWDEVDDWAERFTRWQEYAQANNLMRDRRTNYLNTCFKCKGIGYVIANQRRLMALMSSGMVTVDDLGDAISVCNKCKGRGVLAPKQRYIDGEIRDVVNRLGPKRIQELVKNYRRKR
jgi:DnaJ-class molecular chaperone